MQMNKNQLLEKLKQIQTEFYSDDYYFSLSYWEAVETLIEQADKK